MIIPKDIRLKFESEQETIKAVAEKARETLLSFCDEEGYPFLGRVKPLESLAEKIESGRYRNWGELDDLYACTIIIPTPREENKVIGFCDRVFRIIDIRGKEKNQKDPEIFRFDVRRLICTLKPPPGKDEGNTYTAQKFEIQIRTALEHAWCVATHALVFKSGSVDWKKIRLAAEVKAGLEQFDTVFLGFEELSENITEHFWPKTKAFSYIISQIRDLFASGRLREESMPNDLSRFAENLYNFLKAAGKKNEVKAAFDTFKEEIGFLEGSGKGTPVSITLLQFFVGSLCYRGFIDADLREHFCIITEDLISLYKETDLIKTRFQL